MRNQNAKEQRERSQVTYEILENFGVVREYENGWKKELNLVSWNDSNPKYDIRDWNPDHSRMSKGITLHADEMEALYQICRDKLEDKFAEKEA